MNIQQKEEGRRGYFFYEEDGEKLAVMTYTWQGEDTMIIDHTEADDRLKGKGAGKQLVDKAVAMAHEKGFKISPVCPFVQHLFDKAPDDYADVWQRQ